MRAPKMWRKKKKKKNKLMRQIALCSIGHSVHAYSRHTIARVEGLTELARHYHTPKISEHAIMSESRRSYDYYI